MAQNEAQAALRFDLSGFKGGIRNAAAFVKQGFAGSMKPFDREVDKSAKHAKGKLGGIGKFLKGALGGALLGLAGGLGIGKIITEVRQLAMESLQAFRNYSDSVTTLKAALGTLGAGIDMEASLASVRSLGNELRLAMGIIGADTNKAFANFITRGFDERQARQLTILAANLAKKTGKPIADVQKQIADAANGSVDAMKELGVQIDTTGNKVRDGEAAVLALKAAYGDIGSELANPSERMAAAWNELYVALGEKIAPTLEPVIQGIADFVTGLTQTEEGKQILEDIGEGFAFTVEWIKQAIVQVSNLVEMVKAGGGVIVSLVKAYVNLMLAQIFEAIEKFPGGKKLLEKLGLGEGMADGFKEQFKESAGAVQAASSDFMRAQGEYLRGESDTGAAGVFNRMAEAGKVAREEATASLAAEMAATKNEAFAGKAAQDAEGRKAEATTAAAAKAGTTKSTAAGPRGGGVSGSVPNVSQGQQINVRLVSARSDRFRRARLA